MNLAIESGHIHSYLDQNSNFHFTIYRATNMPILLSIAKSLWMRSGPSLREVFGRFGTSNLPDNHEMAINAQRAVHADAITNAIELDIQQGVDQIQMALMGN